MTELQNGWNEYLDAINESIEAIDFMNEKLRQQGDILDYGKQMLELVYGDKAYQQMDDYYRAQDQYLTTQKETLEKQPKIVKEYEAELKKLEKELKGTVKKSLPAFIIKDGRFLIRK